MAGLVRMIRGFRVTDYGTAVACKCGEDKRFRACSHIIEYLRARDTGAKIYDRRAKDRRSK